MSYVKNHPIEILDTLKQISEKDLVRNGSKVIPATFYVHTFNTEKDPVEQHKTMPGYPFLDKWDIWLKQGRIYIKEEKKSYAI